MKSASLLISVVIVALLSSPALSQPSISNLWKARALDAADNIAVLQAKLEKVPRESKQAQRLRCEVMLEFAYGMHLTEESMVHKFDKGMEFFHFFLNGGEEAGLFDIIYIYTPSGEVIATRIDTIPKKWLLMFLIPGKVQLLMPNDGCVFQFDFTNPFAGKVLD